MKIKIKKIKSDSIIPTHAHDTDAGWDCYAQEDGEGLKGLGFSIDIPNGFVGLICPRSSMNLRGAQTASGVIDSGYKGELKAIISGVKVSRGDKICQLLILPTPIPELVEELDDSRGENGFGSTGK